MPTWLAALAAVLTFLVITGALGHFSRHRHKWTATAVLHSSSLFTGGEPVTYVLWNCPGCTDVSTSTLRGCWTLEQVRGVPGASPLAIEPDWEGSDA